MTDTALLSLLLMGIGFLAVCATTATAETNAPADKGLSVLFSQVGYHVEGAKKVYLRSPVEHPATDPANLKFEVAAADGGEVIYTGRVKRWGAKWQSWWWVLDFTPVHREGAFVVRIPRRKADLARATVRIAKAPLSKDLVRIAMDQLDERVESTPAEGDRPAIQVWRDCGTDWICEISSMTVTLHGLMDLYDNRRDLLSAADRKRLTDQIAFGVTYVLASQRKTASPLTDGFFEHDLQARLRWPERTPEKYPYWLLWHDQAYVLTGLGRAYPVLARTDPALARQVRIAAAKCFETCLRRPRDLKTDLGWYRVEQDKEPGYADSMLPSREWPSNAGCYYPLLAKEFNRTDLTLEKQNLPLTLRTRALMQFAWACTLWHGITGEKKYLDLAIDYADQIADRQFTDWQHPIEGVFGNFYEWQAPDRSFMTEFAQAAGWLMGHITPTTLSGLVELLRLCPDHPKAARWLNVLTTYGENYAKPTARLSPLGIYPVAMYRDAEHGGVKFFQVVTHGGTCLYGQIARKFLELGDYFNDASYQELAEANAQFVVGLNPGVPNGPVETSWEPRSLLLGIGDAWFGIKHELKQPPVGSGFNGFMAGQQFDMHWIKDVPDAPRGIWQPDGKPMFNEDYLPHSHGYVSAVAKLESPFVLRITARDNGAPVKATVTLALSEKHQFETDEQGALTVKTLPLLERGTVEANWKGQVIARPLQTLGGAAVDWDVDFAAHVEAAVRVPELLKAGESGQGTVTLSNRGHDAVEVSLTLSADGVAVEPGSVTVRIKPGKSVRQRFTVVGGAATKPYLVRAFVTYAGQNAVVAGRGRVAE